MKGLELHGNRNIKWESSNTKTEGEGEGTQIRFLNIYSQGTDRQARIKSTEGSPTSSLTANPRSLSLQ